MERSSKVRRCLVFAGRVVHFLIALVFVFAAVAEFSVEPPFFDVLRHYNQRSELPDGVFQVYIPPVYCGGLSQRKATD